MSIKYRQGETLMADYVSQGELAGELVDTGSGLLGVTHSDTASGKLGAVNVGNGITIYEIDKATGSDTFAVGAAVSIDASDNALTTGGTAFGVAVKASTATDLTVWARFDGA